MKFSEFFTSKDNIQLDKRTLVILRWIAIVGQFITISIVYFVFSFELPFFSCVIIMLFGVLTNLYLNFRIKKHQLNNFTSTFFLFYDLVQLSALLYLTGGITNPFAILLIIPAIVSSTFLTLRSTLNLSIITIVILIVLTFNYQPLPHPGDLHFDTPNYYLYAIPTAIAIGLIFLTYFGARFGIESRKRREALNKLELVLTKEHELESIGLQAAAAAHSLGTPLSTISVVVRELEKEVGNIKFYSATYRLFKLPYLLEPDCEDYGQAVIYIGTIKNHKDSWNLDNHHQFDKGKCVTVCGNTYNMLHHSRFWEHFIYLNGGTDTHFGIFPECGKNMPFENDSNSNSNSKCC